MPPGTKLDASMRSNCKASLRTGRLRLQSSAASPVVNHPALQTNKALALAEQLIQSLRSQRVIVPTVTMIDRLCAEALAPGVKLLYKRLTQSLDGDGYAKLDALLLPREDLRTVVLTWLRQPPGEPKARNVLAHLDRLHRFRE